MDAGGVVTTRKHCTRHWAPLLVACAIALAGCGNRLTTEQIRAQNVIRGSGPSAGGPGAGAGAGAGGGDQAVSTDPGGGLAADPGVTAASRVGAGSTGTVAGGSVVTPGGQPSAATGGTKAPIVIGLIGYLSGLAGSTLNPGRDAWVAWQRTVNARGGINGHPVNLLVADDGGNASTSLSIARDFVENKGAIALTALESSGVPFAAYVQSKSIPVIGTITADNSWNQNPMLFPPFPAPEAASWGAARLMKRSGAVKVAFLYCAESQDCANGKAKFVGYAQKDGLQVVYTSQYSVTQPDFTAECLQMKGDGVQAVLPVGDNASLIRMAQSCGRQGFRPTWVTPVANDAMLSVPEFEGAIGVTGAFPWYLRDTNPAVVEYATALQKYAPSRLSDGVTYQSWGWQSAKLFEEAAAHVSDKPTSQDILNGLWSLKGDTLGGLAPGGMARTFTKNQPTPEVLCVFDSRIQRGKWVAPQGLTPVCN